jgi:hypothetical protein
MAVSCPPKVAAEDTQNKAQLGWTVVAAAWDLTASGICQRETGQSSGEGLQIRGIGSGETFHWHSKQDEGLRANTAV